MSVAAAPRQIVEGALARAGFRLERCDKPIHASQEKLGQLVLEDQRRRAGDDFFFIQIGACDGKSFDALYDVIDKYRLRGIVVEPLPDLFNELKQNYAHLPQVTPLNVALHRDAKQIEMYRVPVGTPGVPDWTKGMSSMDPNHHKLYNVSSEYIVKETVPCVTWSELLIQQNVRRVDYLQIDTEGYDYEVLDMLDLETLRPAVIKFEHDIPSRPNTVKRLSAAISRFIENNYHIVTLPHEAIAYSRLDVQES